MNYDAAAARLGDSNPPDHAPSAPATARSKPAAGRSSLVAQAYQAISAGIIEGRYAPGQRLVEADLTQELGISRNTLREALHRLEASGFVQIEAYRGAIVASSTRAEVVDLIAVRGQLESFAASTAATRIHLPEVRELAERARSQLVSNVRVPKFDQHLWENRQFHDAIIDMAGNSQLPKLLDQLYLPVFMRSFFSLYDENLYRQSVQDHQGIIEAILLGDAEAAGQRAAKHVHRTADMLQTLPDKFFRAE